MNIDGQILRKYSNIFVPIKKKDADEWPQDLKEKMAEDGIDFDDGDSEKE